MSVLSPALLIAIFVTVFGQVLYHVMARLFGSVRDPWELIAAAYFFAFWLVLLTGIFLRQTTLQGVFAFQNVVPAALIGTAVACVEMGYMFAYRAGFQVNVGAVTVLALATLALIPIGVFFFKEPITVRLVLGFALTVVGIMLMRR